MAGLVGDDGAHYNLIVMMDRDSPDAKHWFLVHTKPRQEACALENLERQGFECYLPALETEKLRQGAMTLVAEPLFPRYLFIRLPAGERGPGLAPVRSTRGVSRLVSFAQEPARVSPELIGLLKSREVMLRDTPRRLFEAGDRVRLTDGPFAGIDGIYQMTEGERRVLVLIEILSKPVAMRVAPAVLRRVV